MAAVAAEKLFDVLTDNRVSRAVSTVIDKLRLPKTVISDLYKFFFSRSGTGKLQKYLFLVGGLVLLHRVVHGAIGLYQGVEVLVRHKQLEHSFDAKAFKHRYGEDCWVLVTGFTSGLGLSYAKIFAGLGFNLVLVGRNKEKIKHALRWISFYNDQILTKVIDLDFTADAE